MQTDLSRINREQFYVNPGIFCGVPAVLVTPKQIGVKWTKETVIYRSSIWTLDGKLLSAGKKKFVNWGETPDLFPPPLSLKNCYIPEKIDGSLLITDFHNDQLNFRTRGTFSHITLDNAADFDEIRRKYPQIENFHRINPGYSLLMEITSPNNQIVINYGPDVDIVLIGCVKKEDYTYLTQKHLDLIGADYGFKRPARYSFDSVAQMIEMVQAFEGKEGVCIYYHNDQDILKCKALKYLILHRMKSELSGMTNIVDMYIAQGCPDFGTLYAYVVDTFDFELAEQCKGSLSRICDAMKEVRRILAHMATFVAERLQGLKRSEQAKIVLEAYGDTNRAGYVFKLLDGKEIDGDGIKKLLLQVLK